METIVKTTLSTILIVLLSFSAYGNDLTVLIFPSIFGQVQKVVCDCPKTQFAATKADTAFLLSNGRTIVLCGYKIPKSQPTTYSEFVLAVCGQDTIIDFWNAALTCRLQTNKDTLLIDQLISLPTGENFTFQETVWSTEKVFFSGQDVVRKSLINRQIRKYTTSETQNVLKTYERAKAGFDESIMVIANKLFMASISGDTKARQYFTDFKTKFGPLDGAFAEEHNALTAMMSQFDKEEVQILIRQVLIWADSEDRIDLLPAVTNKNNSVYIVLDRDKHKRNLAKLQATDFFTTEFIENYNHIIVTLDKRVRNGEFGKWLVGDMPPFSFANYVSPWCQCQDYRDWNTVEVRMETADKEKGEYEWYWGNIGSDAHPGWKEFKYKFRVAKVGNKWKISYLEGFDIAQLTHPQKKPQ